MIAHHENAKTFMAFCDVTRLKVLELLRSGEKSASTLQEQIGTGQSTLSHHMKILLESGIVESRKLGKWTYYSICESGGDYAARLLRLLTSRSDVSEAKDSDASCINIQKTEKRRASVMNQFTIVADTSCDLPLEYLKEHNIEMLPIPFTLDGEDHKTGDWQKISDKGFYNALRNGGMAKTTLINPESYLESFTNHAKQGKDALYIVLSSGLSGTFQSAMLALDQVKEVYPDCNIYPIDSIGATSINGLLVMLAVKKREEGLSAQETADWLEEKKNSIIGIFTVDDLMYLQRGGRISTLAAVGGSVLRIKPVLNVQADGTLAVKNKVRGRAAALKLMVSQLKQSIAADAVLSTVIIPHTDCEADALKLSEMVKAVVDVREVIIVSMGPVIGAHVGPGAIAVVFESDVSREEYEKTFY